MKRKLLILCACLFGALTGVKAYTTADLTAAGWTQVSVISNDASNENYVGNFVYVLVDAGSSNYAFSGLTNSPGWKKEEPAYRTLANPFTTPYEVWTIEIRNDGYALRNIESQKYFNSNDGGTGEGWLDHMADTYDNGSFTISNDGSKYNIYGISSQGYVGPWGMNGAVSEDGESVAANKDNTKNPGDDPGPSPGFFIYRMAKAIYLRNYLKQCPNLTSPVDVSYLIVNPTIYQWASNTNTMPGGWLESGVTSNYRTSASTGNTRLKGYNNNNVKIDFWQEISNLPAGDYTATAGIRDNKSNNKFKTYLLNTTTDVRRESAVAPDESDPADRATTPALAVDNGSAVHIGVWTGGNSSARSTLEADNFRMSVDPYISSMATEFNNGVEMTAGLWYHFEVANTGNHILTATNLNDIIYATGENTALSAAGSNKFSGLQTLSANTDYYIRSSSNNTLTITPCISAVAGELPDNGAMTAGEWYYFDVATEGHYDVVASSITNIVYTTDGNLAEGAIVENKFSVKDNDLSAVRYYVKSSSAQTLQWFLTDEKDYTSYITNPSFETGDKTGWIDDTAGRGTEESRDDKIDIISTDALPGKDGTYFAERWWWDSYMNIHQTTQELPAGIYRITVLAKADAGEIVIFGKAGSNDEVTQAVHSLGDYSMEVCLPTSGTITLGLKGNHNTRTHVAFDNFRLTYVGPYNEVVESDETQTYEGAFTENTVVTPTAEYPIVNISGASFTGTLTANFTSDQNGFIIATAEQKAALGDVKNVVVGNTCDNLVLTDGTAVTIPAALTTATTATYSRNIAATSNFGTICVPFALESNDNIQYYTVKSISDGVLTLVETSTVDAGVPAVYKKKGAYAGATNIVIASEDAAITKSAGTQGETVQLIGTFTGLTVGDKDGTEGTAANGNYYIGADNRFYEGANYITINPFRAYITGGGVNAGARLTIQIEDENGTTSIVALEEFENENNLKDGKYLIDGKIVIVKNGVKYSANGQILK